MGLSLYCQTTVLPAVLCSDHVLECDAYVADDSAQSSLPRSVSSHLVNGWARSAIKEIHHAAANHSKGLITFC